MSAQSPDIFALTASTGTPFVGALIGPSELLAYSAYASAVGQQFTLADGNTATVADIPTVGSGNSFSLLHLSRPEAATPLALGQVQPSTTIPGLLAPANDAASSATLAVSDTGFITASETGPYTPVAFLSPDSATLYGVSGTGSSGALGYQATGPGLTSKNLPVIQSWLAADMASPTQPASQTVAVHDTTTGADLPDTFSAYTGPVAGIVSQFIAITPDHLNVTAKADNLFVKTGSGDDAVALHGGTNVVDCGTGSNFVTCADGFDTVFLDARNIPAASSAAGPVPGAIWDTIQSFGHGDAATLWGISPGTALVWQKNEGAVGHTGITLHANLLNGSTASLTLAGIDSKAGLGLSYGSSGGANYLYVKAA